MTVAQLDQKFTSAEEKIKLQNRLAEFSEVVSVTIST